MSADRRRRVAISGASGFIGTTLVDAFQRDGWDVQRLVRRTAGPGEIEWDPERDYVDARALAGIDALVHLAAESIFGLWTPAKRRRILESRARGTGLLARTIAELDEPPGIFVSASGVGYYGDRGDEVLQEGEPPGDDFLAQVCVAWESAADPARRAGIRVVHPRFGLVLDPAGGALAVMLLPFRLGLGARLGSGRQWMSWVTRRDAVRAILHAVERPELRGPMNTAAPEPVRNADFTRALARAVHRPAFLTVPDFVLRSFTMGMGEALLLPSQRAIPTALEASGFGFRDRTIDQALAVTLDGNV